jgi:hypothetical protein
MREDLAQMRSLEGLADADAHLGRTVPLPRVPLPVTRWTEVTALADGAVELEWNLDDSRPGAPGRLALYVGLVPPAPREIPGAGPNAELVAGLLHRESPLDEAQPSLRPVHELHWQLDDLHLRLTAQGPWGLGELRSIALSVE